MYLWKCVRVVEDNSRSMVDDGCRCVGVVAVGAAGWGFRLSLLGWNIGEMRFYGAVQNSTRKYIRTFS